MNAQWYEGFNTKVDVAELIGVSFEHTTLLECQTKEDHGNAVTFNGLTDDQKNEI